MMFKNLFGKCDTIDAVVLIDMQPDFLTEKYLDLHALNQIVIPSQVDVLRACADNNVPVVVLEYKKFGETIPLLRNYVSRVPNYRYLIKTGWGGFSNSDLALQLKKV